MVCRLCIPYCPVEAIYHDSERETVTVDEDKCVECGVCVRSGICIYDAFYQPVLTWPRVLRAQFSSVIALHPTSDISGRGTDEMKTNDVTDRYREGEVGFALEPGRPGVGTRFSEVEKITMELTKLDVNLEPENPMTSLIDHKTGRLKDESIRNEKVLSAVIEFKTGQDRALEVIQTLQRFSRKIETVFTVGVISRCVEGKIPVLTLLERAGIDVRVNGKTNLGFGWVKK